MEELGPDELARIVAYFNIKAAEEKKAMEKAKAKAKSKGRRR